MQFTYNIGPGLKARVQTFPRKLIVQSEEMGDVKEWVVPYAHGPLGDLSRNHVIKLAEAIFYVAGVTAELYPCE